MLDPGALRLCQVLSAAACAVSRLDAAVEAQYARSTDAGSARHAEADSTNIGITGVNSDFCVKYGAACGVREAIPRCDAPAKFPNFFATCSGSAPGALRRPPQHLVRESNA